MSSSSFFLFTSFMMIGYMVHPMVLPHVNEQLPESVRQAPEESQENRNEESVSNTPQEMDEDRVSEQSEEAIEPELEVAVSPVEVEDVSPAEVESEAGESPEAKVGMESIVIEAMKTSLRNGDLKTISFDAVSTWEYVEESALQEVQSGLVTAEVTTVLGVKTIQAKAHVSGGAVLEWLWAKAGTPIE